jgi:hypothetical protein
LIIALSSNLALCNNNLKEYEKSIENCNMVLRYDKTHLKALFRRGSSYQSLAEQDAPEPKILDIDKLK